MSNRDIFKLIDEQHDDIWKLRRVIDRLVDVLIMMEPNKKNKEILALIKKIN